MNSVSLVSSMQECRVLLGYKAPPPPVSTVNSVPEAHNFDDWLENHSKVLQ